MLLTPHFQLHEFINSPTAQARHIDNTPSVQVINNLCILCTEVLEPLRQHFQVPIRITSGYRSPLLNRAVGGVHNSQHLLGQAADIHIPDLPTGRQWFAWMMDNLHFDQLILEHRKNKNGTITHWIHVSYSTNNRQCAISNIWK